ncbi:MAG: type II toxin-antitoxin system PemK/MazF family toxin [Parachlamydiaceae bacterium]
MSGKLYPKRGEIYWVDLDPTIEGETQKLRPGLIVSNDIGNEVSQVIIIAPITSKVKNIYSFEVKIFLKGKPAKVMLNQCRAVDKSRLKAKIDLYRSKLKNWIYGFEKTSGFNDRK